MCKSYEANKKLKNPKYLLFERGEIILANKFIFIWLYPALLLETFSLQLGLLFYLPFSQEKQKTVFGLL